MRILLRTSRNSFWMVKEQLLSRVFWQTDQKKRKTNPKLTNFSVIGTRWRGQQLILLMKALASVTHPLAGRTSLWTYFYPTFLYGVLTSLLRTARHVEGIWKREAEWKKQFISSESKTWNQVYAERVPSIRLILLGHSMQIQNSYFQGSFSLVNQWRFCFTAAEHTDTIQLFIWQLLSYHGHLLPSPSRSHICIPCYPREQHRIKTGNQTKTSRSPIYCSKYYSTQPSQVL